ncbi:MAG: DUF4385 domain-containing protein [Candidatus Babeliales bacterium]|nr:DUF4385 domain-containing protein [Candidatus Babeliales bacterium]
MKNKKTRDAEFENIRKEYSNKYFGIDFRKHPELYVIGKGEQGVLMAEPYRSEILPYWKFKTPEISQISADKIYELFLDYKKNNDFVGMDMARKYLQMGFTRSRRYANHKTGTKWNKDKTEILPIELDEVKAESAKIFYEKYLLAKNDADYIKLSNLHKEKSKTQK